MAPPTARAPAMDLTTLLDTTIDARLKGYPPTAPAMRLGDIGRQGWSLLAGDLPSPVAVLKRSALEHNGRWMRRFAEAAGVRLCPHGKTTMAPQLFRRQLADGAWGITVATVHQLLVAHRHGVRRLILANQVVGPRELAAVRDLLASDPDLDLHLLVDSRDGVALLTDTLRAAPSDRPLPVLVEIGFRGGRAGCRDAAAAVGVAEAVRDAAPLLALRGVEAFEGLITAEPDVRAFLATVRGAAEELDRRGLFAPGPVLLTAGGSTWFDLVAEGFAPAALGHPVEVVLRSGCYLTQDSGMYRAAAAALGERSGAARALGDGPRPALELWAAVQSVPEPGRAVATLGKRDASHDAGLPVPRTWFRPGLHARPRPLPAGHRVAALSDQHAHLDLPPGSPLAVGDLVGFGISHPCTTFDRWPLIHVVDDDYRVVEAVRTFF